MWPSQNYFGLQCFDAVGWVIWPVKIVPEMTYKVSSGTLNLCSLTLVSCRCHSCQVGKFKLAKFQYGRVVEFLQFSDNLEGEYGIERNRLLLAAHLNLALCHLKLGNDSAARESADRALEIDGKSEKALFRRGMVPSVAYVIFSYISASLC